MECSLPVSKKLVIEIKAEIPFLGSMFSFQHSELKVFVDLTDYLKQLMYILK